MRSILSLSLVDPCLNFPLWALSLIQGLMALQGFCQILWE